MGLMYKVRKNELRALIENADKSGFFFKKGDG